MGLAEIEPLWAAVLQGGCQVSDAMGADPKPRHGPRQPGVVVGIPRFTGVFSVGADITDQYTYRMYILHAISYCIHICIINIDYIIVPYTHNYVCMYIINYIYICICIYIYCESE